MNIGFIPEVNLRYINISIASRGFIMKKLVKQTVISAAIFMAVSGVAQAKVAQITGISGSAMVERASYRYIAQPGMILEEGDIVRSLENSKVTVQFDSCKSTVEATKEAKISASAPCSTATVAKAEDLKPLEQSKHAIQRIDPNLAEAACKSCAVDMEAPVRLASNPASSIFSNLAKAAIIPAGFAAASSGGSSSSSSPSNTAVSPP